MSIRKLEKWKVQHIMKTAFMELQDDQLNTISKEEVIKVFQTLTGEEFDEEATLI
jgi:hypothetical protein